MAAVNFTKTGQRAVAQVVPKQAFDVTETVSLLITLLFVSKNATINSRMQQKARSFLSILDIEGYRSQQIIYDYLKMAEILSDIVVKYRLSSYNKIKIKALEYQDYKESFEYLFEDIDNKAPIICDGESIPAEMSNEDVFFIDSYVSQRLQFRNLWASGNEVRNIIDQIDSGIYPDFTSLIDNAEETFSRVLHGIKTAKQVDRQALNDFIIGTPSFDDAIRKTVETRKRPSNKIKTGLKLLNRMLNGGYEGGRVYTYFGTSGGGKSVQLLNAALDACDPTLNDTFITNDPTKTPIALYVSGENDALETLERVVSKSWSSTVDLKDYESNDVVERLNEAYKDSICRFAFKFRKSRTFSTEDIVGWIEEYESQGFEVVMLVVDYIKRIKSIEYAKDRHIELGFVVDELSSRVAKEFNIPVITANQLNRAAYSTISAEFEKENSDPLRKLNESNAGESLNVIENSDVVVFINTETIDCIETQIMSFRRIKFRGRLTENARKSSYFHQPFDKDDGHINGMRLVSDELLPEAEIAGSLEKSVLVGENYQPNDTRRASAAKKVIDRKQQQAQRTPTLAKRGTPVQSQAPIDDLDENFFES